MQPGLPRLSGCGSPRFSRSARSAIANSRCAPGAANNNPHISRLPSLSCRLRPEEYDIARASSSGCHFQDWFGFRRNTRVVDSKRPYPPIMNFMARGWESKSVEEQQSAAIRQTESKQRLTPEQAVQQQQAEAIQLSRRRVLQQLQSIQNPRHRQMLESALSELDSKLARLG